MLGYYYLAFVLVLAFVGIGFYLLGPKLKQWDEKLTGQLREIEAKGGKDGQGSDEQLASQARGSSTTVGPQDIGVGASSTSRPAASAAPIGAKKGGVVLPASGLGAFRLGGRVYVRVGVGVGVGVDVRGVVVTAKLKTAVKARHLSSRLRRGVGTLATLGPRSAPRRRVPARTQGRNQ
jgi:hypothetical protein